MFRHSDNPTYPSYQGDEPIAILYDCLWLCMTVCDCVWHCMTVCDRLCKTSSMTMTCIVQATPCSAWMTVSTCLLSGRQPLTSCMTMGTGQSPISTVRAATSGWWRTRWDSLATGTIRIISSESRYLLHMHLWLLITTLWQFLQRETLCQFIFFILKLLQDHKKCVAV